MIETAARARLHALIAEKRTALLLAAFEARGHSARLVGGAVRNALLGEAQGDLDLCTDALPETVLALAGDMGWKAIPTGIEHGTVTVLIEGAAFEITTLREDVATDGRHAQVRFGSDFYADAARRDFTINAMSIGRDGVLSDPFGGLADLEAGRVRFIGDADQRLREDYLRGLRFLRFSARYAHGALDPDGLGALKRQQAGFSRLSRERIGQEFLKLVVAEHADRVIEEAESHGLIAAFAGFAGEPSTFARYRKRAKLRGEASEPITAIGVLFPDVLPSELARSFRLSNRDESLLASLRGARQLVREGAPPRLVAYRYPEMGSVACWLELPDDGAARTFVAAVPPEFHLRGEDLVRAGLIPGPRIGALLAEAERRWIEAGLPEARDAQSDILQAVLATP